MARLLGGLVITVMTLYGAPRSRTGRGRGREGGGLYPELAALGISEGSSPNVQAEVGRLVAYLPMAQARVELARRGLELDGKAVQRIAVELGGQMLTTRTRDLLRWRAGQLSPGSEFAGKRIAVGIDGGRVRLRTLIKKTKRKLGKKRKRRRFRVEWREPKVVILYELDEQGRMLPDSRPVIDGTLGGPDQLMELVAFHLYRLGGASAQEVVFLGDGAPWIWDRLDWVVRRVGLEKIRVLEVLDWPHAVHHVSLALEALGLDEQPRRELFGRLRKLLKAGQHDEVIDQLWELAQDTDDDSPAWREIRYLQKHADAGRLRYNCFRYRRLPCGSGAIESTIRRVVNLRLKGNSVFWKEENAEAVFQLRATLLTGRWEETLAHVRETMARNRRIEWSWSAPDMLTELKTNVPIKPPTPQPAVGQYLQARAA